MMKGYHLDPEDSYHRADLILKKYRNIVWAAEGRMEDYQMRAFAYGEHDYAVGLRYLADFAPEADGEQFVSKVAGVMETAELINMVDRALQRVREYPRHGELYFDILNKKYIVRYPYTEDELLDSMGLTRTTLFRHRKEAVYLFALCLFGIAIPELLSQFCNPDSLRLAAGSEWD